jgi:hypothetical protein
VHGMGREEGGTEGGQTDRAKWRGNGGQVNVYRIEVMVIDWDGIGPDGIKDEIENARYGNRCISPHVKSCDVRYIGKWSDDHPLNNSATADAEFRRLFDTGDAAMEGGK